jgi:glycosyltransferase involved in cell wall biosynthesis
MIDISVAIITLNEQDNISRCLSSLPKGSEIIIIDSGSTDKTVDIAKNFGAKVYTREFDNFASQKNYALEKCKRKWVLSIDADEVLDPVIKKYLESDFDTESDSNVCYKVPRKLVFNHQLMKFGKTKDYPLRFFPSNLRFKNAIHEEIDTLNLSIKKLNGFIYHYSYRDHEDYFRRFNSYTTKIANNHFSRNKRSPNLLLHMLRPFWEFISRYIFRFGFLDGRNGFTYALYSSLYSYVKYEKLIEKRQLGQVSK